MFLLNNFKNQESRRLSSLDYFVLLVKTDTNNRNRSFMAIVLEDIINFEFTTNLNKYGMRRKCA